MSGARHKPDLVARVKEDIEQTAESRLKTMSLAVGLISFGFLSGVNFFAAAVFRVVPPGEYHDALQPLYDQAMIAATTIAIVGLCLGVFLEFRDRRSN